MLGFFYFCFVQMRLGKKIAAIKEKSPEYAERDVLIGKHRQNAIILLIWIVLGFVGGLVVAVKFLSVPSPLLHTYGHGFFGVLALSVIICTILLGFNIKHVTKPKIKARFFGFHAGMIFVLFGFGALSLLTGAIVLIRGISS
jgi:hypothetical protein